MLFSPKLIPSRFGNFNFLRIKQAFAPIEHDPILTEAYKDLCVANEAI